MKLPLKLPWSKSLTGFLAVLLFAVGVVLFVAKTTGLLPPGLVVVGVLLAVLWYFQMPDSS